MAGICKMEIQIFFFYWFLLLYNTDFFGTEVEESAWLTHYVNPALKIKKFQLLDGNYTVL